MYYNKKGVKIYSLSEKRIITYVAKDHDASLRDVVYRCSLLWLDTAATTLVIGWADRFKICKIIRSRGVQPSAAVSATHVQISNAIKTFSLPGKHPPNKPESNPCQ